MIPATPTSGRASGRSCSTSDRLGAVVNCSSQGGPVGTANLGAYTASKHGVIGLTRAASLEYAARGIRINAVCPGETETPMVAAAIASAPEHTDAIIGAIPLGRRARAEEIASAVLWLSSPDAGFMVGQAVAPDGGYTARSRARRVRVDTAPG